LILFVLSAAFSGLAGGMKAILLQFATLADVHWTTSADPILMVLVGGTGTFFGPLVGAAVIVTMQDYLADLGDWVQVIQGLIFVFVVLVFRAGIVGAIAHKWRLPL
jgi:branched-chain amino acid transport system permease protein